MSQNEIVNFIRSRPRLAKMFDRLSMDGRRQVLIVADGDTWHIDDIIEDVLEDEKASA